MKILVVCQHYWPEQFQITDICEGLVERGHEVTVLAGLPNYGMMGGINGNSPGRVLPEYRRGNRRVEDRNGVVIVRAYEFGRGSNLITRTINYHSFWKSGERLARLLPGDYDVVFAYQLSPCMMAAPARAYKETHGTPMLLYCLDLWPESMKAALGERGKAIVAYYGRVSGDIYRSADVIAMQSPAFAEYFESYHNICKEKLVYIPQFATDDFAGEELSEPHEGVNLVFMGNMGKVQGIELMVRAIAKVPGETGVRLHFVGDGICLHDAKHQVERLGIQDRVMFHGRKPSKELPKYYRMADACILALDDSSFIGKTIPSKLQGYMAAGKPVIAAVGGGARSIIEEACCGIAIDFGDEKALAKAITSFCRYNPEKRKDLGRNARDYYLAHFTKNRYLDSIESILKQF